MSGRDNQPPAPYPAANSGEFLLSLLQKPDNRELAAPPSQPPLQLPRPPQFQQQVSTVLDPAIAAVGPSLTFQPSLWQSNGQDVIPPQHWPVNSVNPQPGPNGFLGFPHSFFHSSGNQFSAGNQFQVNQIPNEDSRRLGFSGGGNSIQSLVQHKQQLEHKLKFGSFPGEIRIPDGLPKAEISDLNNGLDRNRQSSSNSNVFHHGNSDFGEQERRTGGGLGKNYLKTTTPPGFPSKLNLNGGENWDPANRMKGLNHNVDRDMISSRELMRNKDVSAEYAGIRGDGSHGFGLSAQLDRPGPPSGSSLRSILASDIEDSRTNLEKNAEVGDGDRGRKEMDEISKQLVDSLLIEDESDDKSQTKQHHKELRSDSRGHHLLSQKMRNELRRYPFRSDIDRLNAPFLSIVESLIPVKEEKAKQKQLLSLLENLVSKEWPKARLYLYGSCANSFGVSKSDIDLCLAIEETDINKAEILLKLADILQSDNLQNVQALTRARVPIVKLMDPVTEISCDICINNVLAVVNTRLLRDYGRIDVRLRQLAFIVKHWAKSRGVNATYQGTLSSYAYVLMCIHFLQNRSPAILPCLQAMDATYYETVDNVECAYFDQIEKLYGFGSRNKQTISQLVWGFFNYWAYCHDYTDSVISVRTGRILSKRAKDWTRRVGNDRHLICIEDPFETSHDLGRVVDKNSIKVLREEFERAAYIMQNDPNPCVKLFEPYIPC